MAIQANVTNNQITATVGETQIDVTVSGGVGPTGAQGPAGSPASLPAGTEGYVLTYVSGSWTAAAPASGYTLPTASASVLGGVKIGSGITITDGVISASSSYTLPTASAGTLGGVKIGGGVTITDGVISVSTNYAAATHSHSISDVTGLQTALDGKQASGSYAASVHSHAISDVTGLQTALDGKQASGSYAAATHSHAISDVTGLQTALDGKAASDHTHAQLHDRSHAITSTSDHTAGNWKVLYSNGSGAITELALGASGTVLQSGGTSAAPSWLTLAASATTDATSATNISSGTLAYARMADPTVTSPSQITSSQNDYAGCARGVNRISSDAARNITGMAAGSDGEVRVIVNVGSFTITLVHQSTSSTAANRFLVSFGADYLLAANAAVVAIYDNTTARWRLV